MLQNAKLLDVSITISPIQDIIDYIITSLKKTRTKYYIVTPNPEIITYSNHHSKFKSILNHSEISLPDGIGIILSSLILKKDIKKRIAGVDLMESICERISYENEKSKDRTIKVGFLGGRGGIAEETAERLVKKYPKLQVGFVGEEWDINKIKNNIDILFVAFGFPKQEEWIHANLNKIPVRIAMAVGGSFDYISGKVPRAPRWMRNLGLEWLFRLIKQPWRWKRQLSLVEFTYLILKEAIRERLKYYNKKNYNG